jgi:hypothetical protein
MPPPHSSRGGSCVRQVSLEAGTYLYVQAFVVESWDPASWEGEQVYVRNRTWSSSCQRGSSTRYESYSGKHVYVRNRTWRAVSLLTGLINEVLWHLQRRVPTQGLLHSLVSTLGSSLSQGPLRLTPFSDRGQIKKELSSIGSLGGNRGARSDVAALNLCGPS